MDWNLKIKLANRFLDPVWKLGWTSTRARSINSGKFVTTRYFPKVLDYQLEAHKEKQKFKEQPPNKKNISKNKRIYARFWRLLLNK